MAIDFGGGRGIASALTVLGFGGLLWAASRDGDAPDVRSDWMEVVVEPPPGPSNRLVESGAVLYGWNCLPCHGPEGRGDGPVAERLGLRARNYTRGLFQLKTSGSGEMPFDDDLFRTITTGIPAAGMPSFRHFEPDERWALVAHVKSLSLDHFQARPARTRLALPAAPPRSDLRRGKRLFQSGCAACHGDRGQGDGAAASTLVDVFDRPVRPPDMTRGRVTFKAGARPADVFRVLTTGLAGSPMPSFDSLADRDRWDLAFHVASLYQKIPEGEQFFLRRGCLACHTVGKGRFIGPDLAGVGARRDPEWLRRWLRNPPLRFREESVRALFPDYPVAMPDLNLSESEIEGMVEYLETLR